MDSEDQIASDNVEEDEPGNHKTQLVYAAIEHDLMVYAGNKLASEEKWKVVHTWYELLEKSASKNLPELAWSCLQERWKEMEILYRCGTISNYILAVQFFLCTFEMAFSVSLQIAYDLYDFACARADKEGEDILDVEDRKT